MKPFTRALTMLIVLTMLLPLSGCATGEDGMQGVYTCAEVRTSGERFDAGSILDMPATLELRRGGKAVLTLDGAEYSGQWFNEDGVFDLVTSAGVSHGTIADGVCAFDLLDEGVVYVFLREGASLPADGEIGISDTAQNALQKAWNGGWYGWWSISNAEGDWAALDRQWYDCFARIDIDADGVGTLTIWDESMSAASPMGEVSIAVTPGEDGAMGTLTSTGGTFWLAALDEGEWTLDPTAYGFENMLVVNEAHYDSGEGSFDYTIVLRPWGTVWSDVESEADELLPYYYNDWYLPAIDAGEAMPDSFDINAVTPQTDGESKNEE